MTSNHETLHRQWQMLRLIPRYPYKITAKQLYEKLHAENYVVTKRTIERDLMTLSESFPIVSDERDKPYGWSWAKDGVVFDLPGLSSTEALTFNLVEQHLKPILPASTLTQLQPYFVTASEKLASMAVHSPAHSWLDKVRVIQPTQTLLPPTIDSEAQRVVSEGLLQDKQLKVAYQKRGDGKTEEYVIHPLGLVERGQMIYLVCTMFSYQDVRILALHRIRYAEMLEESSKRPKGFSLDDYIESGAFGFGGGETIRLKAIFKNPAGDHLHETPLSVDQVLSAQDDSYLKLTATVVNTEQLRWWLLGFGEQVEVLAPAHLRKAIVQSAQALAEIYRDP
jgi:predicted DNA-binding transcriptional regulator YafY